MNSGYEKASDRYFLHVDQDDLDIYPQTTVRTHRSKFQALKRFFIDYQLSRRWLRYAVPLVLFTTIIIIVTIIVVNVSNSAEQSYKYGLKVFPVPKNGLIQYRAGNERSYRGLVESVSKFLAPYRMNAQRDNKSYVDCLPTHTNSKSKGRSCRFEVERKIAVFDDIVKDDYGFKESLPCIWLQLHTKPGLYVHSVAPTSRHYRELYFEITCDGQTDADSALLRRTPVSPVKDLEYFPVGGFSSLYFPATDAPHYLPPIVLVRFNHIHSEEVVAIRCTAWTQPPIHVNFKLNVI